MIPRRVIVFLVVPLVVGLESFAWYGLRQNLVVILMDHHGMPIAMITTATTLMAVGRAVATFVGGVAAALIGPYVAATVGLVLSAVGIAVFALAPNDVAGASVAVWVGLAIGTFGNGFALPGLWAGPIAAFARPAHLVRDAVTLATYAALQIGVSGASFVGWALYGWGGGPQLTMVLLGCAGVSLFAAVLTGCLAGTHLALPPVPEDDPSERFDGRLAGLALLAGVLCLVPYAGYSLAADQVWAAAYAGPVTMPVLFPWINPLVVLLASGTAALVAGGLAALRVDAPTLVAVGVGFLACAVGAALAAGGTTLGTGQIVTFLVSMALLGLGEAIVQPLLVSRLLGDLHWRLASLYAGLWFAGTTVLWWALGAAGQAVTGATGPQVPLLAGVAACSVGGLVVIAGAVPYLWVVRAVLDEPAEPIPEVSV